MFSVIFAAFHPSQECEAQMRLCNNRQCCVPRPVRNQRSLLQLSLEGTLDEGVEHGFGFTQRTL